MFLSGATKLLSGDPTWRAASPRSTSTSRPNRCRRGPRGTPTSCPAGVHHALTLVTLVVEVVVPWLLLLPGPLPAPALGAAGAIALLQIGIAATGNYGFFNALTLVLCLPLLDDAVLARLRLRSLRRRTAPESATPTRAGAGRLPGCSWA